MQAESLPAIDRPARTRGGPGKYQTVRRGLTVLQPLGLGRADRLSRGPGPARAVIAPCVTPLRPMLGTIPAPCSSFWAPQRAPRASFRLVKVA